MEGGFSEFPDKILVKTTYELYFGKVHLSEIQ